MQCARCAMRGPTHRCPACDGTRSTNLECPDCRRGELLRVGVYLHCEHCPLVQLESEVVARIERRERASESMEIEGIFRESTRRAAPGGSDDGCACVPLEWMARQQAREESSYGAAQLLQPQDRPLGLRCRKVPAATVRAAILAKIRRHVKCEV